MNKKIFIICLFFIFLFAFPFYYQFSFSKYIFNDAFTVAKIQIDKKPTIEILGISNTNTGYEKYANSTHVVAFRVKITEKNIAINHFNRDTIQIFINNSLVVPSINVFLLSDNQGEIIYDVMLSKLTGNGNLSIVFPEGMIEDTFGQKNSYQKFDTGILIDNIAPTTTTKELSIENNQSQYIIQSNENLRPISGWDFYHANSSLSKVFSSPIRYPITIIDYAGNSSEIFVNIQNATNMMLYYANHTSRSFIENFDSNGQISGKQNIIDSSSSKSERILTCLDSNITNLILQARIFDYTYWGENTTAICHNSEIKYSYGYNPSPTTWYDVTGPNAIRFIDKIALQLGGYGHNSAGNSCLNQTNPIPQEIAEQNLYGLSGIAFQLKNCEEYSIVYQIYVPSIGWLKASSDGEETTYAHDKPFSAIRMNIVPKSEKQRFINYWNRVIYTDYIE